MLRAGGRTSGGSKHVAVIAASGRLLPKRKMNMLRKLLSVAALALCSLSPQMASAQHNPSAKADGDMRPYWNQPHRSAFGLSQSYRRFSYAPSVTAASPVMSDVPMASVETVRPSGPIMSAPAMQSMTVPAVVATVPTVPSYRRYSYQPSVQTRAPHTPAYLYSKPDPRRNRN